MAIEIRLENFQGPLDILLHLIKTNEMDIYDIPMVEISEQYLAIIDQMKQLNLDGAGEFLLMAATLIHIKSRMLLPVDEGVVDEGEEEDPRAELVRRLLEYQRYKEASEFLETASQLDRDVFVRHFPVPDYVGETDDDGGNVDLYQLAIAFQRLLKEAPQETHHEVVAEPLSVAEYIRLILQRLRTRERRAFSELFSGVVSRDELVVTFLALLELVKMRMVRLLQTERCGALWLTLAATDDQVSAFVVEEGGLGYG
ncbi:MAG: segregation/condensation protein A [Desulfuromonas sp.]|nr:MAG: segregation/condensation protein A [Desulfuromonas sp.]